jgi:hypothetical protein
MADKLEVSGDNGGAIKHDFGIEVIGDKTKEALLQIAKGKESV